MILLHYLASLWLFIGSEYFMDFEEGHLPWIVANEELKGLDNRELFIFSTYWVCTVVTSVGYGDYTGGTTLEYLFTFCIEFFGLLIFTLI